ncbi:hypothetical protein ACH5RR_001348 [Cinchona calisaya]|uniref:Uncharacterized protein n=1 Tax=Cinchona calisaya TaxID=153742 RepID=A0ABD3B348_9GENT
MARYPPQFVADLAEMHDRYSEGCTSNVSLSPIIESNDIASSSYHSYSVTTHSNVLETLATVAEDKAENSGDDLDIQSNPELDSDNSDDERA